MSHSVGCENLGGTTINRPKDFVLGAFCLFYLRRAFMNFKKKGAFITFFLSIAAEIAVMVLFLLAVNHVMIMYVALLLSIMLFVFVYWSNTAFNELSVTKDGKSVLSKKTRKIFNIVSSILSIALLAVGVLVFVDYYYYPIFSRR